MDDKIIIFDQQNNCMVTGKKYYRKRKKEVIGIELTFNESQALTFDSKEEAEIEKEELIKLGFERLQCDCLSRFKNRKGEKQ